MPSYKIKHIFILLIISSSPLGKLGRAFAQTYPVQITAQLQPPFSGYIPDYTTPGNQNLKLLILFTDFAKPVYNIKLRIKISGQNVTIQSKSYYYTGPFTLQPGIPIELSGSDLNGLLATNNLDFSGISIQQYNQQKVLPEGAYNICFTAYDFNNLTPIQVSNESCAFGWMLLSDPPFLNLPMCGSTTITSNPQNVLFQWTPMNLSSPNSAFTTEYDFELFEIIPGTQSAGNIVQTLPTIYKITTPLTFVNYGITEPVLNSGMEYVWRVRARDITGRDVFKNKGYSQQCTFHYGSVLSQIDSSTLKLNLKGNVVTHRVLHYNWDSLSVFTSYKLEYRKLGGTNWFPLNTTERGTVVNNLEPENTYEARVKGIHSEGEGLWSNTVTLTTPAKPVIVCGQGIVINPTAQFKPLTNGMMGQIWDIGQFEMIVTHLDVSNNPSGSYSGYGKIQIPFMLNLNLKGKFSNILVNDEIQVVQGKVEIVTIGIDTWLQQWPAPAGWNQNDNLGVNGTINTVDTSNGSILVNGNVVGTKGTNTTITGSDGTIYYVSTNGTVTSSDGTPGAPVSNNIASLVDSLPTVEFTNGSNAVFAFDSKEITAQTGGKDYDVLPKEDKGYAVAYKLLQTGSSDKLTATIASCKQEIDLNTLIFKRTDGTIISATKT